MAKFTWRMSPIGLVLVTPEGGDEHAPTLGARASVVMDRVIDRWDPLCKEIGVPLGIPDGWGPANIVQESGGNPGARNRENPADPTDDGIGLFQITSKGLKGGRSDAQLFDPRTNVTIGLRYVASLIQRYGTDFPKVSASFNAGSVRHSDSNPWGMVMTGDHVGVEVAALNYYLMRSAIPETLPPVRVIQDEEILAQSLAISRMMTLAEDFGARDLSRDEVPTVSPLADAPTRRES